MLSFDNYPPQSPSDVHLLEATHLLIRNWEDEAGERLQDLGTHIGLTLVGAKPEFDTATIEPYADELVRQCGIQDYEKGVFKQAIVDAPATQAFAEEHA
jgi:hypothetical protein